MGAGKGREADEGSRVRRGGVGGWVGGVEGRAAGGGQRRHRGIASRLVLPLLYLCFVSFRGVLSFRFLYTDSRQLKYRRRVSHPSGFQVVEAGKRGRGSGGGGGRSNAVRSPTTPGRQ